MVTQITLGNIFTQNGRTVIGGSQSGIDTEALINGLVAAKRLGAVRLETANETLSSQKSALSSLKSLLTRFRTAVDTLRNPPGVGNASSNVFEYRTANISTNTGVSGSNYISVTASPGANVQNFTIDEITQLARGAKQESNTFLLPDTDASVVTASGVHTAGLYSAGTFSLRVLDGGADAEITLAENDSLQTVVNKFNDVKSRTGIQASIIKVANGSPNSTYEILFSSTNTGETYDFDLEDPGTVTADVDGVLSTITHGAAVPALNAEFTMDGIDIERESNSVGDLIDGLTFTLRQETPALTTIAISIEPDTEIALNAITQFADVYNEFRLFAAQQQEIGEDGTPTEDAVLYSNNTLRTIMSQIAAEVTREVEGILGDDPTLLADIGITFDNFEGDDENPETKNIMVVDTDAVSSALLSNFEGVRSLFEYTFSADNSNLITFKRTNALALNDFNLVIVQGTNTYEARDPDDNSLIATFDFSELDTGVALTGQAGTVLEGLELIFASDADATVHVTVSQGMGDRLFNLIETMLDDADGSLTLAIDAVEDQEDRNSEEITKIDEKLETYRDQLVQQYASLEAALSKANSLLQLLDAQSSAREANS